MPDARSRFCFYQTYPLKTLIRPILTRDLQRSIIESIEWREQRFGNPRMQFARNVYQAVKVVMLHTTK